MSVKGQATALVKAQAKAEVKNRSPIELSRVDIVREIEVKADSREPNAIIGLYRAKRAAAPAPPDGRHSLLENMRLSQQTEASYRSLASIWCSANRPGTRTALIASIRTTEWSF